MQIDAGTGECESLMGARGRTTRWVAEKRRSKETEKRVEMVPVLRGAQEGEGGVTGYCEASARIPPVLNPKLCLTNPVASRLSAGNSVVDQAESSESRRWGARARVGVS